MRRYFPVLVVATLLRTATLGHGDTAGHVGIVKTVAGEVIVSRSGRSLTAVPNLMLRAEDIVQTGANGKAGIILDDDTVIALGFNSRLAIEKFLYRPEERKLALVARLFQGTASFVSGKIAKLAPRRVQIRTPHGTVGVRGTHVLIEVD